MKSSFYNLKAIVLISIVLLNCDNSSKEDKTITNETCEAELKELKQHLNSPFTFSQGIPEKFEFCNTNEAVLPKSDYNTITGIAKFSIPIPKGSNIKLMEKKKDTLFYECYGHDIVPYNDQDLIIENIVVR